MSKDEPFSEGVVSSREGSDPASEVSSLVELLRLRAASHGERTAYTYLLDGEVEEASLTYGELDRKARAIAAALQSACAPGDRALLLYPAGLDYVAALFGCLYARVIAVPAYPPRPARAHRNMPRLMSLINDSGPAVALSASSSLGAVKRRFDEQPALRPLRWIATDEIGDEAAGGWREPEVGADDLAFLQYTSGSTSTPKGVMLSHRNLLHNEQLIRHCFQQTEESVIVGWLPLYHDMGLIGNVLQPLYVGARCVLMSPTAFLLNPSRWLRAITQYRGTTSGGPNFAYDLCVRKISPEQRARLDLSSWVTAFNGAEPVRHDTMERFAAAFGPCGFRREAFSPCYGLAEATLIVSGDVKGATTYTHTVRAAGLERHAVVPAAAEGEGTRTLVGCGQVLLDQKVVVADPETFALCPSDTIGEVWVSGQSVAHGYWNRPAETERTFGARLAETGEGPYLRTGDLGFLNNGHLFITGRLKDLIVIRGRNHYPQDVELTTERAHPALRPGGGAAFSVEVEGEERLVLVQEVDYRRQPDLSEVVGAIRQAVSEEHEVPLHAVALIRPGSIPKTSSGKIQRHACREKFLSGDLDLIEQWRENVAPAGEEPSLDPATPLRDAADIENWLAAHLASRLRVDVSEIDTSVPIGRYGVDSLLAIELTHSIEARLGLSLPVVSLLQSPSIAELAAKALAQLIASPAGAEASLAPAAEVTLEHPLSYGQQALYFLHQLAPESAAYNIARAVRVSRSLDAGALRRAFQTLVDRHASLRTTFEDGAGGKAVQVVRESAEVSFEVEGAAAWGEEELRERLLAEAHRPFDLGRGPLMRVRLYTRAAPDEHFLLLSLHHIVADFWSLAVLINELRILYLAESTGTRMELAPVGLQYGDYVRWQAEMLAGGGEERYWGWWREQLAGGPPALDLPADRPRPAAQTYVGASLPFHLDAELSRRLRAVSNERGATLYMMLLAAFQVLLHRYTGQEDISVGSPTAGRSLAELTGLVGYFVNPVVLRANLSGEPTFAEFLEQVRQTVLGAFEHQDYPFPLLVERLQPERDPARSPLFQVMFSFQKTHRLNEEGLGLFALGEPGRRMDLGGLSLESVALGPRVAQFDLTLLVAEAGGALSASVEYNTDLFDASTVERMAAHFRNLLEAITADAGQRISELPLLSEAERRELLVSWNDTRADSPPAATLHALFEAQAAAKPDAHALDDHGRLLTYRELNAKANRLARHLRRLGVGPESRVGVLMGRSSELVVSLLAVLKAGGAYVPLDPRYPRERLSFMLEDSAVSVLLTQEALAGELAGLAGRVVTVEGAGKESEGESSENPAEAAGSGNLAYVIYTSGSTGRPKGVAIEHRSAAVMVAWALSCFGEDELSGVLFSTSVCFDLSVFELFAPLSCGGAVVVAEDALELATLGSRGRVTLVNTVPSAMGELVRAGAVPESVAVVNLAGEPLKRNLVERVYEATRAREVRNLYGPSEDTTYSTMSVVDRLGEGQPTIGRPIANTQTYVLDTHLRPVPVGVSGELFIGGDGLARGYLNRPALTAERFIPNPFAETPGARMYRTGDVVRYLHGGELAYLGRSDNQVKLRGYRIELGEIEAALEAHAAVREAAVVVREEGVRRLVAYVVAREPGAQSLPVELRAYLKGRLPEYMVPSEFVSLAEMPLTPNGKVDRKALPAPERGGDDGAGAPGARALTPVEEILAGVWAEVLGVGSVGADENFFELGGHSLLATQVASRVREAFGVEMPLRRIFEAPTVAGLAEVVAGLRREEDEATAAPPLVRRRAAGQPTPLSFAQRRLWFLDQLEPGNPAYNMPGAVRLRGPLRLDALGRALNEIVRRHETLRTVFRTVDGELSQVVLHESPFELPVVELDAATAAEREAEARRLATLEARKCFDLSRGPLLRALLLRLDGEEHVLLLTMHHIISDGWSMGVLVREAAALYEACALGQDAQLPELEVQYADYTLWERERLAGEVLEGQLAYWRTQLAGAPDALELPADRPRPKTQSFRGATLGVELSAQLTEALRALSRREGVTLFMSLLAAFQTLLARYTGQEDIAVGTPIANRPRRELEQLIGFFVNTLVLRTDLSGDPSFRELLRRVREVALGAYAHQDLPFEMLVEELQPHRDMSRTPLFQSLFVLQNTPGGALALSGLTLSPVEVQSGVAKFDLSLQLEESPEGLKGVCEYSTDLFDAETIRRMLGHFETLLYGVVADPSRKVSELPLLSEAERGQLLTRWEETAAAPPPSSLHALFEAQVARTPDAHALDDHGRLLTYRELNDRAERLARRLRSLGVGPESRVGVLLERSAELVVSLLAVLKSGGAYVPLDPQYPQERLRFMLEDSSVEVLLTRRALAEGLGAGAAHMLDPVDAWDEPAREGLEEVARAAEPDNLAYVIYTSGSTGRPKGVAIEHRSAAAMVEWALGAFTAEELSGVLFSTSVCFDLSVFELFAPLSCGGAVVVAEDALELATLGSRGGVTLVNTVPSAMSELVRMGAVPESVAVVNLAGEPLKRNLVERVYEATRAREVRNLYGPSEDTTYSTMSVVEGGRETAPTIGRPVTGTRAYVLDRHLRPVPVGVSGELFVAGVGLARGYLNRPALTAERFIPDPLSAEPGARMYRTGDVARYLRDGELEFLGRADHQVKVRGFRIELGEVEAALEAHAGVREAVVVASGEGAEARLVAYVVCSQGARCGAEALREHLRKRLPEYMVPAALVELESLPLTPNGKVDRKALPAPERTQGAEGRMPRTPVEEVLAGVWADVLGVGRVGAEENFFGLGGHSLLATRVVSRLRDSLRVELPLRSIFEAPTVAELASLVEKELRLEPASAAGQVTPAERREEMPLSFAQERLWFLDQLGPGNAAHNISLSLLLRGPLDRDVLERSVNEVVRRHEILRTTFGVSGGEPVQRVAAVAGVPLVVDDLVALSEGEREAEMRRLLREGERRPFDLSEGLPLRVSLVRLGAESHALQLTLHHIAGDGWSVGVLWRELRSLYEAYSRGEGSPLPELPVQYADYASWQREWLRGEGSARELAYWRGQLADAPTLELPADRPRPAVQTSNGASEKLLLDERLSERVAELGRRRGVTLFMTLLAAFKVLLARHAGQEDVVVGTPIANRGRSEVEGLIGLFLNTLVLRTDLSGDPSFGRLLERVREVVLAASAHQEVPFEKLLAELQPERDLSRTPFFQVFFNMLNFPLGEVELPGVRGEYLPSDEAWAKFDLTLYVREADGRIELNAVYNTDLFLRERIVEVLRQFRGLLEQAVEAPDENISRYTLLTPEAAHLLPDPSEELSGSWEGAVHTHLAAHARATPEQPAVSDERHAWSYSELDVRANRLANFLRAGGIARGDTVAVYAHRSAPLVWAVMGILKAGAAFVILDPTYPAARLIDCLELARPRGWLQLEAAGEPPAALSDYLDASRPARRLVLTGDAGAGACDLLGDFSPEPPPDVTGPDDLAYVAFTSGTTGRPKAILGRHGPLTHFVPWLRSTFDLRASDRYSMLSGLAHDPLHRDMFTPLTLGASVRIPGGDDLESPRRLVEWMRRERVSIAHLTPAMGQFLSAAADETAGALGALRYTFLVGDVLTVSDVARLQRLAPAVTCVNYYGTTETQRAVGHFVVPPGGSYEGREVLPLGRGIRDVQLLVLGGARRLAGVGEVGEVYVRSPHLARGYIGDPALTEERFVTNPLTGDPADRLYRTGDLGRYLPDGNVEPLGRADLQVKIRGFRVELKEIEAVLAAHEAVRDVAVVARDDAPGGRRLVAYVVARPERQPAPGELRAYLKAKLPAYMIPSAFVALDALPLTPNGKLDRRALPDPDPARPETGGGFVAPRDSTESALADIWREVLGVDAVSVHDNFFDLGGHSLLVVRVLARVRQVFAAEVPLRELFEAPTVAALAVAVVQQQAAQADIDEMDRLLAQLEQLSEEEAPLLAERGEEGAPTE